MKSLALAYGMKKKAMKGEQSSCNSSCEAECAIHPKASGFEKHEGDVKRPNHEAIEEDDRDLDQHGAIEEGPEGHETAKEDAPHMAEGGMLQSEDHEMDMVGRIMKQREQMFSEGGRVANEAKSNRGTDFLATNDDLEFNYTESNSGDELSSPGEDERRKDIVSRVMASRRKKDRLPNPR